VAAADDSAGLMAANSGTNDVPAPSADTPPPGSVATFLEVNRRTKVKRHSLRLLDRRRRAGARSKVGLDTIKKCFTTQFAGHAIPDLYVRGASGNVGPAIGSMEMVADFDTWESGPFFSGGDDVGTGSWSANVNLYMGVGYKGKNRGKPLYDSYKGWFDAVYGGFGIPIPYCGGFCSANFGVVFSVSSADGQAVNPTCQELMIFTFTAGVGASLIPAIPISLGVTITNSVSKPTWFRKCAGAWSKKLCMALNMGLVPTPDNWLALLLMSLH